MAEGQTEPTDEQVLAKFREQPCVRLFPDEGQKGTTSGDVLAPYFAPVCRGPKHRAVDHHARLAPLCDCPCHGTVGPWYPEAGTRIPTKDEWEATRG